MDNFEVAMSGVALAARILNIKTPDVQFFNDINLNEKGINAVFLKEKMIIAFNEVWILSANTLEIQTTCFHETRHVFQYLVVSGKYKGKEIIKQATINTWKQDMENYERPSGVLENDEDYLTQDIEIDAIAFAHYHMNKLFDVSSLIPEVIRAQVSELIKIRKEIYYG
ncbi:MAG: hypothetical protein JEZ05_01420 [Tenericutes bacterium]|nr:hypothetical protein [Mycoplasmatota bacterium]